MSTPLNIEWSNNNWTAGVPTCIFRDTYNNNTKGKIIIIPRSGLNYNPVTQSEDTAIIYGNQIDASGAIVIGPWSTNVKGLRLDKDGICNCQGFNALSDYRIKTNVLELDEYYTSTKLRPIKYYTNGGDTYGFFAHEVSQFYPELVKGEKDEVKNGIPIYQSINYNGIIPILTNDIIQMDKRISKLENIVETLMKKLETTNNI
jgi:hypothetical protein